MFMLVFGSFYFIFSDSNVFSGKYWWFDDDCGIWIRHQCRFGYLMPVIAAAQLAYFLSGYLPLCPPIYLPYLASYLCIYVPAGASRPTHASLPIYSYLSIHLYLSIHPSSLKRQTHFARPDLPPRRCPVRQNWRRSASDMAGALLDTTQLCCRKLQIYPPGN